VSRKQKFTKVALRPGVHTNIGSLVVVCDICQMQSFEVRCLGDLEEKASKLGWKCHKRGADLCPVCKRPEPKLPDRQQQRSLFDLATHTDERR